MKLSTTLFCILAYFIMQRFGANMLILSLSSSHSSFLLPSAACGRGFYKSSSQDLQCSRCPAHSFNDREGSWRCDCEDGYYRALSDPPSVGCTSKSAMPLLGKHSTDHLNLNSHTCEGKKHTPTLRPVQSVCSGLMKAPRCVP